MTVQSKFVLIVIFPNSALAANKLETMQSDYRRQVVQSGDESLKSSNYFISGGLDSLVPNTSSGKKFVKNLHELVVAYYREKRDKIKKKQTKLVAGH